MMRSQLPTFLILCATIALTGCIRRGEPPAQTSDELRPSSPVDSSIPLVMDMRVGGEVCVEGVGMCQVEGSIVINHLGQEMCLAMEPPPPMPERCATQRDEDCDGEIDEGFELLNTPCTGVDSFGLAFEGMHSCSPNRLSLICKPMVMTCSEPLNACGECGPAPEEVCDGADNDCDGQVDEGLSSDSTRSLEQRGVCAGSYQRCQDGVWVDDYETFQGYEDPEVSGCDALDNDCDGLVDEQTEVCNARDDDCDGYIDEQLPECVESLRDAYRFRLTWTRGFDVIPFELKADHQNPVCLFDQQTVIPFEDLHMPEMGDSLTLEGTTHAPTGWDRWIEAHRCTFLFALDVSLDQYIDPTYPDNFYELMESQEPGVFSLDLASPTSFEYILDDDLQEVGVALYCSKDSFEGAAFDQAFDFLRRALDFTVGEILEMGIPAGSGEIDPTRISWSESEFIPLNEIGVYVYLSTNRNGRDPICIGRPID